MNKEKRRVFFTVFIIGLSFFISILFFTQIPLKKEQEKASIQSLRVEEEELKNRIKTLQCEIKLLTNQLTDLIQEFDSFEQYLEVKKIIEQSK